MRRLPVYAGGVNESEFSVVLCLHGAALLTVSACSVSSCLVVDLTLAIISVAGMYAGVNMSKFSSFFSRAFLALLRDLEDKLFNNPVRFVNIYLFNNSRGYSRLFLAQKFIKFLLLSVFGDLLGVGLDLF